MKAMDSVKARMARSPKQAIALAAIVGVVVGAVVGLGVGYKWEHDRTANEVTKLKAKNASDPKTGTTVAGGGGSAAAGASRKDGVVTAVGTGTITIKTTRADGVIVKVGTATAVGTLTTGSHADVVVGSHVLVPSGGEILVLPKASNQGRVVASIGKGLISLKARGTLKKANIKFVATTVVDSTTPGAMSDVKVGDHIVSLGLVDKTGQLDALNVIIVPASSKFAG